MGDETRARRRPFVRSVVIALGAALLYGGWALWANRGHGWSAASSAAGTQALASFTITLAMTSVMEALCRTTTSRAGQFVRAAGGSIALSVAYTVALHVWMGTPELLETVTPSIAIGSVYSVAYAANLVREAAAHNPP